MTKKLLLTLLLALTGGISDCAQAKAATEPVLKTYQGEYKGGKAAYTYYVGSNGQRVRHGSFETVRLDQDAITWRGRTLSTGYTEHREAGTYAHGVQSGRWTTTVTRYSEKASSSNLLPIFIENRQSTALTYVNGRLSGLATYADVPWKAGKPGTPTTAASALRRTQTQTRTLAVREAYHFRGDETQSAGRDTTIQVTEYGAGPFRYDAAPDLSDPAHRPQTVRGFFNEEGYCDSTWTLHYWKSRGERNPYGETVTAVQKSEGWMNTTLWFANGVLRRERTMQSSTGEIIHQYALPPSQPYVSTSRLVVMGSPAHALDYFRSVNNDDPDNPDWNSPIKKDEDASHYLFIEAMRPLGAPLLFEATLQLAPTAADSAVLHQSETLLAAAHAQWLDMRGTGSAARPASDTTGAAFRALYLHLYDLLAAGRTSGAENASDLRNESEDNLISFRGQGRSDDSDERGANNPYPWLQALVSGRVDSYEGAESSPDVTVAAAEKALLVHLKKIQGSMARVQAHLGGAISH